MVTLAAISLTCWLCSLIALPRKPLPNNDVQELVYTRLLGRQRILLLFALVVTVAAVLATILALPQRIDPTLRAAREQRRVCTYPPVGFPTCYRLQIDGMWTQEALVDGNWVNVGAVSSPPTLYDPYDDPGTLNR